MRITVEGVGQTKRNSRSGTKVIPPQDSGSVPDLGLDSEPLHKTFLTPSSSTEGPLHLGQGRREGSSFGIIVGRPTRRGSSFDDESKTSRVKGVGVGRFLYHNDLESHVPNHPGK